MRRGARKYLGKGHVNKDWLKEDELSGALLKSAEALESGELQTAASGELQTAAVQVAFQVNHRNGAGSIRDPAKDFVRIGSAIAQRVLAKISEQQIQQQVQLTPEPPQEWDDDIRAMFKRNLLEFKLVHAAFGWMCAAYRFPREVLVSQWRRFGIAAKRVYAQRCAGAKADQVGDVMSKIIDEDVKPLVVNNDNDECDDCGEDVEECAICLLHLHPERKALQTLSCGHSLHTACFGKGLPACPLCRAKLDDPPPPPPSSPTPFDNFRW